jgi:arylformamidase
MASRDSPPSDKTEVNSTVTRKSKNRYTLSQPRWIDISVPVFNGLVHWPGDPTVSLESVKDMASGAANDLSKVNMGSHSGTHIDAPSHFIKGGKTVSSMPLDQTTGIARVIEIHHTSYVTPEELAEHHIRQGERILLKTRNSSRAWYKEPFNKNFVSISSAAADFIAKKALKAVGIDYLSVGAFRGDGGYIHRTLLGSGIWLIEGIDLSAVNPGKYFLYCLPLRLEAAEGAPARALLRPV